MPSNSRRGVVCTTLLLATATLALAVPSQNNGVVQTHYDGVSNDLLTAGLGKSGLAGSAPAFDPVAPTAEELRRLAIYNNYRALVDITTGGGYGVLYGPNIAPDGSDTLGEGKIGGDEYIAFESVGGRNRVTMMVQVPDTFSPTSGCIVTAPSSGSRGIYGAIATAGEWGLKHGCAVAYTDKGSGTGADDLQNNTVNLLRGERADVTTAGNKSNFTAIMTDAARAAFNSASPNRFAFKHAHSQQNPERDWGLNVLRSVEFAFEVLNNKFSASGIAVTKRNTIVIASSVSNGGGASVRAVEEDHEHLIDGLAVGEPNVNPKFSPKFTIRQGGGAPLAAHSRPLIDYITLVNVFQGCASAASALATAPLNLAAAPAACSSLAAKGLLKSGTTEEQAGEAQAILNAFGILPEQNAVQPGYWFANVPQSISVTYANAYGRVSVLDNLCNFSFGATAAGVPAALAATLEPQIFGTSNGIPPTAGVNLINNAAPGGSAKENRVSTADQNLDGALCLRSLATARDAVTGAALAPAQNKLARRIAEGAKEIVASGDLRGVPAVFVTGRNDGILPLNFASRAYFGLNNVVEGSRSKLRYYEVTNAHHLDTLNAVAGYGAAYIPLHRYFVQAMDLMYDHLRHGRALPPSQVVHTVPRGGLPTPPAITAVNVPAISDVPAANALITFAAGQVQIPD